MKGKLFRILVSISLVILGLLSAVPAFAEGTEEAEFPENAKLYEAYLAKQEEIEQAHLDGTLEGSYDAVMQRLDCEYSNSILNSHKALAEILSRSQPDTAQTREAVQSYLQQYTLTYADVWDWMYAEAQGIEAEEITERPEITFSKVIPSVSLQNLLAYTDGKLDAAAVQQYVSYWDVLVYADGEPLGIACVGYEPHDEWTQKFREDIGLPMPAEEYTIAWKTPDPEAVLAYESLFAEENIVMTSCDANSVTYFELEQDQITAVVSTTATDLLNGNEPQIRDTDLDVYFKASEMAILANSKAAAQKATGLIGQRSDQTTYEDYWAQAKFVVRYRGLTIAAGCVLVCAAAVLILVLVRRKKKQA